MNAMTKTDAITTFVVLTVLAALAGAGAAQPVSLGYGDLILSGHSLVRPGSTAVLTYDVSAQRFATLYRGAAGELFQWVGMQDDNKNIALLSLDRQRRIGNLYNVSPRGSAQVLGTIRSAAPVVPDPTGAVWDPQGRLLIGAGDGLFRYDPARPSTIQPIFRFPPTPTSTLRPMLQSVAVGPGPGGPFRVNYFALNALPEIGGPSNLSPPFVYRFDPRTNRFTSFITNKALLQATSISFNNFRPQNAPRQQFVITRGRPQTPDRDLLTVDLQSGGLRTLARFSNFFPAAHKVTKRGTAWVVGATGSTQTPSLIQEVDLITGRTTKTIGIRSPAGFQVTGVEEYGTNMLHLTGTPQWQDSPLTLWLETADVSLAGKFYLLVFSLGNSPPTPLTVGTNTVYVNLAPDWLFFLSWFAPPPMYMSGTQGVLDANGNATATLTVPSSWNTGGLNIYAAWVVYDTNNVLRVSETELFVLP